MGVHLNKDLNLVLTSRPFHILDKHQVEPLANDLIEKGDAIIAKYEDIVGD